MDDTREKDLGTKDNSHSPRLQTGSSVTCGPQTCLWSVQRFQIFLNSCQLLKFGWFLIKIQILSFSWRLTHAYKTVIIRVDNFTLGFAALCPHFQTISQGIEFLTTYGYKALYAVSYTSVILRLQSYFKGINIHTYIYTIIHLGAKT